MVTETFIPAEVRFDGACIPEVFVLVLHDPDSDNPHGSLTTHHPLPVGARGRLEAVATRGGERWQITLTQIEVHNSTAVGCEFAVFGPVCRVRLSADG